MGYVIRNCSSPAYLPHASYSTYHPQQYSYVHESPTIIKRCTNSILENVCDCIDLITVKSLLLPAGTIFSETLLLRVQIKGGLYMRARGYYYIKLSQNNSIVRQISLEIINLRLNLLNFKRCGY